MKVIQKILLILELIVGFGLLLYFWLLGLIMSPLLAVNLASGDIEALLPLAAFILGGIGLWGMLQLSLRVISPTTTVSPPERLKKFLACGYVAIFIALGVFGVASNPETLIFILPLVVATHFIYISRGYLWQSS
jgi:hypothetical protein